MTSIPSSSGHALALFSRLNQCHWLPARIYFKHHSDSFYKEIRNRNHETVLCDELNSPDSLSLTNKRMFD